MKVKEILRLAVLFTDQKELLEDDYFLEETPAEPIIDEERQEKLEALLQCLNLVYGEITTDYLPLTFKEKVVFEKGKLEFSSLTKTATSVVALKNALGKSIRFKVFPELIEAKTTNAEIEYHFEPEQLELNSEIYLFGQRIPARVFAFGVAMEHFFMQTQSTEALIWENRYKNALLGLVRKKHNITLPARRWVWCLILKNFF